MKGKYVILLFLLCLPVMGLAVGEAGYAVQFDGSNDAVITIPQNTSFNAFANHYTFEAWINPADFNVKRVFLFSESTFLFAVNTSGKLEFQSLNGAGAIITSQTVLNSGHWAHVAVVCDGAAAKLYINGTADQSANNALFELPALSNDILIGRALVADNTDFKGELDEVRMWKTARPASDLALYDRKVLPLPQSNLLALYAFDGSGQIASDAVGTQNGYLGSSDADNVFDPTRLVSGAPIGGHLTSPNSGSLAKGDPLTLQWTAAEYGAHVHILYSKDAGTTWAFLAYNTENDGSYDTFVPGQESTRVLFRIADPNETASHDESDHLLTIGGATIANWKHALTLEAEDGTFSGNFFPAIDGKAFNSEFAYGTKNNDGWVELSVDIPAPGGLYVVWANVWGPGSTRNSFYISVDGGDQAVWDIPKRNQWEWDIVSDRGPGGVAPYWAEIDPLYLNLSAGTHTIRIRKREAYARVDRLVLTNDLDKIYWGQMPYRWIDFTSPVEKDSVTRGEPWEITWDSQNYSADLTIKLSYDRGITFPYTIVSGTENDGSYIWNVPEDADSLGVLFISHDGQHDTYMDQTWRPFYFVDPALMFTLLTPNGGDTLYVNESFDIKWKNTAFGGKILIEYSSDNGGSWQEINTVAASDTMYTWTVPTTVSDLALVKITPIGNDAQADVSDSTFVIMERPPVVNDDAPNFALYFDGVNDFVEIPDSDSLDVVDSAFTIEFMLATENPTQSWTRIMEKGSWDEYYFGFYGPKQKIYGGLRADIGNDMTMMHVGFGPTATELQADEWYHVSVTYDGIYAITYVNGVFETIHEIIAKPRSTTGDLVLGAVKRFGNYYGFYQGMIDDVRIWSYARDHVHIQDALFTRLQGTEDGLVAYYPFDEGVGQLAIDVSSNLNHGQLGRSAEADDADPLWMEVDWQLFNDNSELMNNEQMLTELPSEFTLKQNYPNPFNPSTTLEFDLPQAEHVTLTVYNVAGQFVETMIDAPLNAGTHQMQWNADDMPSGVYIYRIQAGAFSQYKRMLLIK